MGDHFQHDKQITADILKNIAEYRLHIAYIETDGYAPRFGYSIGLYKEFNHPELIVIGLDFDSTGAVINNAKNEIEKGTRFIEGINYPNFLINFPIQFVEVEQAHYSDYLGYAGWYNDNTFHFPTLQIVWPDRNGNYPWQDGFNKNLKFQQPLLDRNTDFKFLEDRNLGVFATTEVLAGKPILFVSHDEDGDWQFSDVTDPDLVQAKLVCLEDLVKVDPSLNNIYFLNYGETASRDSIQEEWKIYN